MKIFAALVLFVAGLALTRYALEQVIPVMPYVFVKALGWALPSFAFGYLFARWRALRLVSRAYGETAAAALNKRL